MGGKESNVRVHPAGFEFKTLPFTYSYGILIASMIIPEISYLSCHVFVLFPPSFVAEKKCFNA